MFDVKEFLQILSAIVAGIVLLSSLFLVAFFLYSLFLSPIPFMCEECGHVFLDGEDPADRCPICDSD